QRAPGRRVEPLLGFGEFGRGAEVGELAGRREQARLARAPRERVHAACAALARGGPVGGGEARTVAGALVPAPGDRARALARGREVDVGDAFGDEPVEVDIEVG